MSQHALISVLMLFCLKIGAPFAQVPTLDPAQTVNTATGEMGFSLPLGVVKGVNGHDFPINLNYKSGIKLDQQASPVGLGFDYSVGSITRKVVHVPDELIGGSANYEYSSSANCNYPNYKYVTAKDIVGYFISLYCPVLFSTAYTILTLPKTPTFNAVGGGAHTGGYDIDAGKYQGFFIDPVHDLPDIYYVNTPLFSGEMRWSDGKFHFRSNSLGVTDTLLETKYVNGIFEIILPTGIKLRFAEVTKMNSIVYIGTWGTTSDNVECLNFIFLGQYEPSVMNWHLTSVEYRDGTNITFEYEKIRKQAAVRLPSNAQIGEGMVKCDIDAYWISKITPSDNWCYDDIERVARVGHLFEDVYLKKIITPNEQAIFEYSDGRKDDLWFDREDLRIHDVCISRPTYLQMAELRNPAITQMQPLNRKVLDKVVVKSKNGKIRNEIAFSTDYSLRPNTFYSFTIKKQGGEFVPVPYSPNAGVLTLNSITIKDEAGNTLPPVKFNYCANNPNGWNPEYIGKDPNYIYKFMPFYIEEKDYWGYYSPNPLRLPNDRNRNANDFNVNGNEEKVSKSDAWSLSKAAFPNGLTIEWEYEPHRYDSANGVAVKRDGTTAVAKFGGGIRTKKMTIRDGINSTPLTRSYFYTEQNGCFVENRINGYVTNSSGHATAEPYPYLNSSSEDKRPNVARGGFYTSARVLYQKVQVVDNYIAPDETNPNGIAPYGYTVCDYITPKEYQNIGDYGRYDYDWKRGMLCGIKHYDKSHKLVSKDTTVYEVMESIELKYYSTYPWHRLNAVRIKETQSEKQNVVTKKIYEYAKNKTDRDIVKEHVDTYLPNYEQIIDFVDACSYNVNVSVEQTRGDAVFDYKYGNVTKADIFGTIGIRLVASDKWRVEDRNYLMLLLGEDIELTKEQTDFNWKYGFINLGRHVTYGGITSGVFGGLIKTDINKNGVDDIIFGEIKSKDAAWNKVIVYHIVRDIPMSVFKNKKLLGEKSFSEAYDGEVIETKATVEVAPLPALPENCEISCAGITDISESGITGIEDDMVLVVSGRENNVTKYKIYAVMNMNTEGISSSYICSDLIVDNNTGWCSNVCFSVKLLALDDDNKRNDLVINSSKSVSGYDVYSCKVFKNLHKDGTVLAYEKCENGYSKGINTPFVKASTAVLYQNNALNPLYVFFNETSGGDFNCIEQIKPYFINSMNTEAFDVDGFPNQITEIRGSDMIVQQIEKAYWNYSEIGFGSSPVNRDLLSNCQTRTYKGGTYWAVAAQATKWNTFIVDGQTKWLPFANYRWNVPMDNGVATEQIPTFNYTGENSAKWQLQDSIGRINKEKVVEALKPGPNGKKSSSVTVVDEKALVRAQISNARFEEGGVFTCDYDLNGTASNDGSICFDLENGWKKGAAGSGLPDPSAIICEGAKHFGEKGLKVTNSFGAVRNFKLEKGKDYIFSAWVKLIPIAASNPTTVPLKEGKIMNVTYRTSQDNGATWPFWVKLNTPSTPEIGSSGKLEFKQYGDWYHIKLPVSASKDLTETDWNNGYQYAVAWVGCPEGNGADPKQSATIYVDDIRFYPKGALVSSTYYDQKWFQPALSIDANNKPGQRVTYDEFGRPKLWEKLDLTKATTHDEYAKEVMEKEYHLMGIAE